MRDEGTIDHTVTSDTHPAGRAVLWRSAFASMAALTVLVLTVVWAYRLGVQDAHEIPVIRAMVEDMRIAPEDPGGLQVAHQGRRVYVLVGGEQASAEIATDRAPAPEPLLDEDVAMGELAPELRAPAEQQSEPAPATSLDAMIRDVLRDTPEPPAIPIADGLPSRLPTLRPTLLNVRAPATAAEAIVPGTPQPAIQLGAYLSQDMAIEMWRSLSSRNGDLLAGRDPMVSELVGSNRTLYGLRAVPFATTAEAQGLCAALRARNEDCLVTEVR